MNTGNEYTLDPLSAHFGKSITMDWSQRYRFSPDKIDFINIALTYEQYRALKMALIYAKYSEDNTDKNRKEAVNLLQDIEQQRSKQCDKSGKPYLRQGGQEELIKR